MKMNIGINDVDRHAVGRLLNILLADEFVLYTTTRDYHWNVTGPGFLGWHEQFAGQSEQVAEWIDQLAERVRSLGIGARGNWSDLTKAARTSAKPGINLFAGRMFSELLDLHEQLIVQLRADADTCAERHHDVGTADFLTGLMAHHEKIAWMLRAELGTSAPVPDTAPPAIAVDQALISTNV